MTIPFGRRRLILTVAFAPATAATSARSSLPQLMLGADDHDLARLSQQPPVDIERARWEGLALLYGGSRRP